MSLMTGFVTYNPPTNACSILPCGINTDSSCGSAIVMMVLGQPYVLCQKVVTLMSFLWVIYAARQYKWGEIYPDPSKFKCRVVDNDCFSVIFCGCLCLCVYVCICVCAHASSFLMKIRCWIILSTLCCTLNCHGTVLCFARTKKPLPTCEWLVSCNA